MKKKFYSIIVALFITVWNIKPAAATIVIDGTEFTGKTAEWAQVLLDSGGKSIQQVMQDALMHGQGFVIDTVKGYLTDFVKNALNKDGKSPFEPVEDSTKQKNVDIKIADRDAYQESVQTLYNKKYDIAKAQLEKEKDEAITYGKLCESAIINASTKKQAYEAVKGQVGKEEAAFDEYSKAVSNLTNICNTADELNIKVKEQQEMVGMLEEQKLKAGTDADPKYVELKKRAEASEQAVIDETPVQDESQKTTWEEIDAKLPTEDEFKEFYKKYFDDPESNLLSEAGSKVDVLKTNTQSETVEIQRKWLRANTAIHLLQVSASARREVPVRSHAVKQMYENTKTESGETAAINAFAQTRIENARALLLYAKLLSAKLQYMAAHELYTLPIQLERDNDSPNTINYGKFDMQHYELTEKYKDELVKRGNKPDVNQRLLNVKDENTEWRP